MEAFLFGALECVEGVMEFEIMFDDLKEDVQRELLELFKTTVEEENWEVIPMAVISREVGEWKE